MKRYSFLFLGLFLPSMASLLANQTELTKEEQWRASYVLATLQMSEENIWNADNTLTGRDAYINAHHKIHEKSGVTNYGYAFGCFELSNIQKEWGVSRWFGLRWDHHPDSQKICKATHRMLGALANNDYPLTQDNNGTLKKLLHKGEQELNHVSKQLHGRKNKPYESCKKLLAFVKPFIDEQMQENTTTQ